MKNTWKKAAAFVLALALVAGAVPANVGAGGLFGGTSITAYADESETLLTTITATGEEQASYSVENVATVSFSGVSTYNSTPNWGWWGYGWTATVTPAEGYTITKCVFYDDKDRTATDSEAPFVVETTEEDKTPQVNGTPILAYTSKGITKIEVYGYATPVATDISDAAVNLAADNTVASLTVGEETVTDLTGFDITYGTDDLHTATAVPTDPGTYRAYVTARDENTAYTGTAKSAEFTIAASAEITGAATVNAESSLLRFAYNCNVEDAEAYGVLIKRDAVEELLTEETASADKQLDEAADFFRSEDSGRGITLRPYYVLNGERIYGEQVYYTYDDVNAQEGYAAITGAAVYNAAKGKIDFTYEAHYEGEGTVTYGVLIKRGLEEGVKLTRKLAAADYPLSSAEVTFRSQDKGAGITLRPYIEIDGVRKYGAQVTYYLSDLVG